MNWLWPLGLLAALVYLAWDQRRCDRHNERLFRNSEWLTRCERDRWD